jgi:hypothetical protein
MAVPAKSLRAPRLLIEPSASALARSSKERLVDCWLTCFPHSPKGGPLGDSSPAQLTNEGKYEGLQTLAQLPRIHIPRTPVNKPPGNAPNLVGWHHGWYRPIGKTHVGKEE